MNKTFGKDIVSRIVTGLFGLAVFACVWFWIAGGVCWWQGWVFLLTFILYVSILVWRISRLNPDLVRERNLPAEKAEAWDRKVMGIYSAVLVVLLILSALDGGRFHWSFVPLGIQLLGWGLLVLAGTVIWQVMKTNAYLSSWARLQDDRGQVVVQEGLYQHIRHPMYLGIIVGFTGIPLVLGSWWAMVPAFIIAGLFIYRTVREDQMLIDGLPGYHEYTKNVKYRLLPRIW
ncbi:MAG: isoprenylcysteine carboxylmethyltransferase family protein [Anaerolineales bacterium]|nr:isoprenylcysteine carboxylmethyltransferase family protein [Anaerolineales bacterium]